MVYRWGVWIWTLVLGWSSTTNCARNDRQATYGISEVVNFSNRLVPKLLQSMLDGQDGNLVVAPFGLATNLAMVMEGIDAKSAADMAAVLHISNRKGNLQELRHGFKSILEEFERSQSDSEVTGSYNTAHINSSLPLLPAYEDLLKTFYRANITKNVNSTGDHVLELRSDTGVMSHWKNYDKLAVFTYLKHQEAAPFTTSKGDIVTAPMIPQVGVFRNGYLPRLRSRAVEIPLETSKASLFLIMPDPIEEVPNLLTRLKHESLESLLKSLAPSEVEVNLPQFAIVSSELDLKPFLRTLGLRQIFSGEQGKQNAHVKHITQNAYFATSFVSVNSVGATNIAISKKGTNKRPKRQTQVFPKLVFNRPFLFFLIHKTSGIVLLAGIVRSPTQVPSR